ARRDAVCGPSRAATDPASSAGPSTSSSVGNGGSESVVAHVWRTSALILPCSGGASATSRPSSPFSGSRIVALLRLADRRHVKVRYPERGHRRAGGPVAPFARQRDLADACLTDPAQQVKRAFVEPEVVDRAGDLTVLDQVHTVAGEPGQQQHGGIDDADAP